MTFCPSSSHPFQLHQLGKFKGASESRHRGVLLILLPLYCPSGCAVIVILLLFHLCARTCAHVCACGCTFLRTFVKHQLLYITFASDIEWSKICFLKWRNHSFVCLKELHPHICYFLTITFLRIHHHVLFFFFSRFCVLMQHILVAYVYSHITGLWRFSTSSSTGFLLYLPSAPLGAHVCLHLSHKEQSWQTSSRNLI